MVGVASCQDRPLVVCLPVVTAGVTPDQVSLGVLMTAVPRDAVDAAVAGCGVGAQRSDGTLPPHVTAYLTMALCLFAEDDYEEVATKVTGASSRFGCWEAGWQVPSSSGITQARVRLGAPVMAEIFESVVRPVGTADTRGAWLRGWRVLAIDGFDADMPDTEGNAAEFGYAGSGDNRSAFPKARADELADGYHQRWEQETGHDQLKTHLRGPGRLLRSRLPELVYQEIWAWLIVHYAMAVLITRAAEAADVDPDRVSFTRMLRIARRTATGTAGFPP
jgi:hypothetical protein